MEHSNPITRPNQGENLYRSCGVPISVASKVAVDAWYDEIRQYNWSASEEEMLSVPAPGVCHFTQLVWKDSTKIGIGISSKRSRSGEELVYIAARYSPQGNFKTEFANNVPRLTADGLLAQQSERSLLRTAKQDHLEHHNRYRQIHGVPDMNYCEELARSAQAWADHLALIDSSAHDTDIPADPETGMPLQGENIYTIKGIPVENVAAVAVNFWYERGANFKWDLTTDEEIESQFVRSTSFTQMIWDESRKLGVGISQNGDNVYLVTRYSPPGNLLLDDDWSQLMSHVKPKI